MKNTSFVGASLPGSQWHEQITYDSINGQDLEIHSLRLSVQVYKIHIVEFDPNFTEMCS